MAGGRRFRSSRNSVVSMERAGPAAIGLEALSGIELAGAAREEERMSARYGMVIDLDRCTGYGSCMMACV